MINFFGFIWSLPLSILVGIFFAPFYGLSNLSWDSERWCITATAKRMIGDPSAQCVGSWKTQTSRGE